MDTSKFKQTNITSFFLLLIAALSVVQISLAQFPTRAIPRELKKEMVQENKEVVKEKTRNILEQAKDVIREKIKKQIKGKLTVIVGNILTIQNNQTTFTVTTTDKTELKRRFGAASALSEFKPNDQLLVIGNRKRNTDGTLSSTDIEASYIRNMSIQRRFAVFNGEVKSITGNTITLQTKSRGLQTVNVSSATQYMEKNVSITLSNLAVGDNLIVKGELWDRVNDIIDAKMILRLTKRVSTTAPVESNQKQD